MFQRYAERTNEEVQAAYVASRSPEATARLLGAGRNGGCNIACWMRSPKLCRYLTIVNVPKAGDLTLTMARPALPRGLADGGHINPLLVDPAPCSENRRKIFDLSELYPTNATVCRRVRIL
jgi:hypothetical protein